MYTTKQHFDDPILCLHAFVLCASYNIYQKLCHWVIQTILNVKYLNILFCISQFQKQNATPLVIHPWDAVSVCVHDTMHNLIFEGHATHHLCISEDAHNTKANCNLINMYCTHTISLSRSANLTSKCLQDILKGKLLLKSNFQNALKYTV